MTAKEAMQRMIKRYRQKHVGRDINDYQTVFLEGTNVIFMEYFMPLDGTLESTLKECQEGMLEQIYDVKNVMLQIICGKDFKLIMNDMNALSAFAEQIDKNVNVYCSIDNETSSDFKLCIDLYIIK